MAKIFIGVDGNDAGDGVDADDATAYADRIKTPGRLNTIIAGLGAGPHTVCISGRYTLGDLGMSVGGTMFPIAAHANAEGIILQSAKLVIPAATAPEITNYQVSTSAAEWTLFGTNARGNSIWRRTSATAGGRARRVFGGNPFTDANFWKREIFEAGTNSTSTATNLLYPSLGLFGNDWTQYNAAGSKTDDLYIVSDLNPVDRWGAVSWLTSDHYALLTMGGLGGGWRVDRSLVLRGGGDRTVNLFAMGSGKFEADILNSHPYQKVIALQSTCTGTVEFAPRIDPQYDSFRFYSGDANPWSMGANHGIDMTDAGFSGSVISVNEFATNGAPTVLKDLSHGGIVATLASGKTLERLKVTGVHYDGGGLLYNRFIATAAVSTGQVGSVEISRCTVRNTPTMSQPNGYNVRVSDCSFHGKKTIGNGYVMRMGGTAENQTGNGCALGIYSNTGYVFGRVEVLRNTFDCMDGGGLKLSNFGPAFDDYLHVEGNEFIRSDDPDASTATFTDGPVAMSLAYGSAGDVAKTSFVNNVAVGAWSASPVRIFVTSGINSARGFTSSEIAGVNQGWKFYSSKKARADALRN